jgi:DNA processing protein
MEIDKDMALESESSPRLERDKGTYLANTAKAIQPPQVIDDATLRSYLSKTGAGVVPVDFVEKILADSAGLFTSLFYKGNLDLLNKPMVSVVGTRAPSREGVVRATKVTELLCDMGFVVLSGLAKGIDSVAHKTALEKNGLTVAVMGTPIHKIYPAENKLLAEQIILRGLLLSPALPNEETGKYLFPRRNKLMALLSKATIIVEAGPTSGVIHQAAECLRQKRTLILLNSLAENKNLPWVPKFLKSGARVAENSADLRKLLT